MARWGSIALCDKCPHRRVCDYRLALGRAPNPSCPDGWVEGPVPAHMIPGPQYRQPSGVGKHNTAGEVSEEPWRSHHYNLRHFCLACACEGVHTPITNKSVTWLCSRHIWKLRSWKRATGRVVIPRPKQSWRLRAGQKRRQAIIEALTSGPLSLREIASILDTSPESARHHLKTMQRQALVETLDLRRGQSWVAWQLTPPEVGLIPQDDIIQDNITP